MSELQWIKHDGGPMPVPGDMDVHWMIDRAYWSKEMPAGPLSAEMLSWEIITEYAIVKPSQARALDSQEGGDHYKSLAIQPAEYMMANNIPFMEGCVIKYVTRWRDKGGVEDLRKARHFLDMLIENEDAPDGQA